LTIETLYCHHCKNVPEKLFRFRNYEKTVTIDNNGNGSTHHLFELLNDGVNFIQRFPFRFSTVTYRFDKTLPDLERDNEFEIISLDNHNIRWDTIEDGEKVKHVFVIFDQKVKPEESRKYSIRYYISGLFKMEGEQWTSFKPIHFYEKMKLIVIFYKNYKVKNVRYCVESPGKEPMYNKCGQLDLKSDGKGNDFVEIEESYPRINFQYRIEWDLDN